MSEAESLKILVPTNFSKKSEEALDFALRFTAGKSAEIYLFHVFEASAKHFRTVDKLNEEHMSRMKEFVMHGIQRVHKKGVQQTVESVHRRLAHGKPATEILKMADGIRADMVILGAPETSAFKKLIGKIPCTMVLVKNQVY